MSDTPKEKPEKEEANDQAHRSYYYDDAHGYEDYDPDTDIEDKKCEEKEAG